MEGETSSIVYYIEKEPLYFQWTDSVNLLFDIVVASHVLPYWLSRRFLAF